MRNAIENSTVGRGKTQAVDCSFGVRAADPQSIRTPTTANLLAQDLLKQRLPETFEIYTYGCDTCGRIEAVGTTTYGTWSETVLITAANAQQKKHETRADFEERLKRLSYRAT